MKRRLEAIVDWVRPGSRIVDIGSDHLIIPNWLIDQGICSLVFATDVNPGPLRSMATNKDCRNIDIQRSDGLLQFQGEIDSAIIAGMGGRLIAQIMDASLARFLSLDYVIVQPMQQVEELREYLMDHFEVVGERLIAEDGKLYHVLLLVPGQDSYDPILTKRLAPPEELKSYMTYELAKLNHLLPQVPADRQQALRTRMTRLEELAVV